MHIGGFGVEVAYRSCDSEGSFRPLTNVGWKCKGHRQVLPITPLESTASSLGVPPDVIRSAVEMIVSRVGHLTLRLGDKNCDVFSEVQRCHRLGETDRSRSLLCMVDEWLVCGSAWIRRLAEPLRAKLFSGAVVGVIGGWEICEGSVQGRSLYVNCGYAGRWGLWNAIAPVFFPRKRAYLQGLLGRGMFDQHRGVLYFKASDDGSASIHVRGLGWEEAHAVSCEYAESDFILRLRDLYAEPPDVLGIAAKPDGSGYCTAYFQHYVPPVVNHEVSGHGLHASESRAGNS